MQRDGDPVAGAQAAGPSTISDVLATLQLSDDSEAQVTSFVDSLAQGLSGPRIRKLLTYAASHLSSRISCKDKNFLQNQEILAESRKSCKVKKILQSQENIDFFEKLSSIVASHDPVYQLSSTQRKELLFLCFILLFYPGFRLTAANGDWKTFLLIVRRVAKKKKGKKKPPNMKTERF